MSANTPLFLPVFGPYGMSSTHAVQSMLCLLHGLHILQVLDLKAQLQNKGDSTIEAAQQSRACQRSLHTHGQPARLVEGTGHCPHDLQRSIQILSSSHDSSYCRQLVFKAVIKGDMVTLETLMQPHSLRIWYQTCVWQ